MKKIVNKYKIFNKNFDIAVGILISNIYYKNKYYIEFTMIIQKIYVCFKICKNYNI